MWLLMIICLESSILGGHLSNEIPGLITGELHLAGVGRPCRLELTGNFCRDIAGCRIDLHNPLPDGNLDEVAWIAAMQSGFAGVITASYRVNKLPRRRRGDTAAAAPEGLKNLLFMEWFNQQGQRLLVQSWQIQVKVGVPHWRMSVEEEAGLLRQARVRRKHFLLNQRGEKGSPDALHAPGMADPFEPHDLRGDPFDSLPENLPASKKEAWVGSETPMEKADILQEELRRFCAMLRSNEAMSLRPVTANLLSAAADMAEYVILALKRYRIEGGARGHSLKVDLEHALPLFSASLQAVDKLAANSSASGPKAWLAHAQTSLLSVELRVRDLLNRLV